MKKTTVRCLVTALLFMTAGPALAQMGAPGAPAAPARRAPTTTIIKAPPMQTGVGGGQPTSTPSKVCTPCDAGNNGNAGYNGVYTNAYGYPVYPGPNVPLPAPGSYYANPYDYYDNYNPNNPYGYSQNTGYYNNGYYNSGYYNQGGYAPSGGYPPNGSNFPGFQGYNTNGTRAK